MKKTCAILALVAVLIFGVYQSIAWDKQDFQDCYNEYASVKRSYDNMKNTSNGMPGGMFASGIGGGTMHYYDKMQEIRMQYNRAAEYWYEDEWRNLPSQL